MTRLFCYKMTHDSGFAPNPFWGFLTLATCKPSMRRSKKVGDWVGGFTSRSLNGDPKGEEKLVFLMQVKEKPTIAQYFLDSRFEPKKPDPSADLAILRAGDNIYRPLRQDAKNARDFEQLENPNHWDGTAVCGKNTDRKHDVSGGFALVADKYVYFGRDALHIPPELRPAVPHGQTVHGSRTHDVERARSFVSYVLSRFAE